MAQDMGRGIMAPNSQDNISATGVAEMRTIAATAAAALTALQSEIQTDISTTVAQLSELIDDAHMLKPRLEEHTDMNELDTPGIYMTGPTSVAETIQNLAIQTSSTVLVLGDGNRFFTAQIQIPVTSTEGFFFRAKAGGSTWKEWQNLAAGQGETANWTATPPSHEMRVQAFRQEYPLVSTEGKGVVVFRYDHGLTNLKEHLLPLHRQYDIPFYVALNSRLWDEDENSGASQADVQGWIAEGIAEVGNHTADHKDRNTAAGMYDTVVNGRKELEDQLGVTVHGFTVPGVSEYDRFEGFGGGNIDAYSDTLMGGLVLANHAIASGIVTQPAGSVFRTLDGIIRQGGRHAGWETRPWSEVKSRIDEAASQGVAVTLMAHPRTLGMEGRFDLDMAHQVLSYVRSKIDAGELANISYYQSHHATTAPLEPSTRIDTSVGTRVFVGDTMIYGDTGWRELPLPERFISGRVLIKRENNDVTLRFESVEISGLENITVSDYLTSSGYIPHGFRPIQYEDRPAAFFIGSYAQYRGYITIAQHSRLLYLASTADQNLGTGNARVSGELTWTTSPVWPATEPGTPA